MTKIELYHSDCIITMQELAKENKVVQHIITDPPYNISTDSAFHSMNRRGLDFGEWDKSFNVTSWIPYAFPLLDKDGSLIIFCSYKYTSDICCAIESLGGVVKDIMVWQKLNPMPRNINRRYVQDMEFAIWAVKSKKSKWIFNKPDDAPYLRGFFQFPTLQSKERTGHPTQKPVALMKKIIQTHTNPNDLILDPFMGVGSTGVAAMQLDRRFIGCEQDKQWFKLAQYRLDIA